MCEASRYSGIMQSLLTCWQLSLVWSCLPSFSACNTPHFSCDIVNTLLQAATQHQEYMSVMHISSAAWPCTNRHHQPPLVVARPAVEVTWKHHSACPRLHKDLVDRHSFWKGALSVHPEAYIACCTIMCSSANNIADTCCTVCVK